METTSIKIANVQVLTNAPTELPLEKLYTWVIWQFPQPKSGGLCAAVHPPIANYGWIPAIVHKNKKCIHLFGHLEETFASPEDALAHLNSLEAEKFHIP
ncbi:MAG: hypothetical protein D6706_14520 [Chloroflexi bacterium]|nr:MAG: hypothetical protein D6706_14520 [Chloroflexota bacterium]